MGQIWYYNPDCSFGPVVEKGGADPFISKEPAQMLSEGFVQDLPWVTGVTQNDGLWTSACTNYFLHFFNILHFLWKKKFSFSDIIQDEDILREFNDNWSELLPFFLVYNDTLPLSEHKSVAKKIRKEYFGSKRVNIKSRQTIVNMQSDREFYNSAYKSAKMQASVNKAPVWFYVYDYRANVSLTQLLTNTSENLGKINRITVKWAILHHEVHHY